MFLLEQDNVPTNVASNAISVAISSLVDGLLVSTSGIAK